MQFHTTERLGTVQGLSKEGFLICSGVPVSRTGTLLYAPGELPIPPGPDGLIRVNRTADEVFHPNAISSFEGKSVVDLHPGVDVTPANWRMFAVGHMQNVRRGTGDQEHVLLADLIIKDGAAIKAVRDGKRHVSLGYDAEYRITAPGFADQTTIIGNHVALVPQGRCGPTCSIGDSDMSTRTWLDRLRSSYEAKDDVMFASAMAEAPAAAVGSVPGGPVIHVHTTAATADKEPEMDKAFAVATSDALTALKTSIEKLGTRFTDLEGKVTELSDKEAAAAEKSVSEAKVGEEAAKAAKEAKAQEDGKDTESKKEDAKKDDEKESAKTGDSSGLAAAFQDAISRAEILIPGVALPTFDAGATPKTTEAALCGFRRRVLQAAQTSGTGRAHVNAVLPAGADMSAMTCDAVGMVFLGATALAQAANNRGSIGTPAANVGKQAAMTPSMINEINRKFYNAK